MKKTDLPLTIFILALFAAPPSAHARVWNQADWTSHRVCRAGASVQHAATTCLEVIEIAFPPTAVQTGVALLVPGFTQNARFWDLWPERRVSFARHLMSELGLKVYLLNPNGIGNSDRVRHGSMDDIAINDIPAALEFVSQREHDKIVLMGHSQGGVTLLASLGGLTRDESGRLVFSREVALGRQALVRGAAAVASNVTMRSEGHWRSTFRKIIRIAYDLRGFLAAHHDWIAASSLGGPWIQKLLRVPRWGIWDFLYSIKKVDGQTRDRLSNESVEGTAVGILNQFTSAMVGNRPDQGVKAVDGPYYWEGLKNIEALPIATIFFGDDSMARPVPGLEDTYERIPSARKIYFNAEGQRHEDFAIMPALHGELDGVIRALMAR